MGLRTNEEIAFHIKPESSSKMTHEMVAAGVVGATGEATSNEVLIKANAFSTNARGEFGRDMFRARRYPDSIEVVEKWAIGKSLERTPAPSPRHIAAKPQLALKEDDVAAKNRISTAGERRKNVSVGVGGCRRRNNRAYTESQISLLPISRNPCEKQHAYRRNQM